MPQYLDFLLTFGDQDEAPDPSISGFREMSCLEHPESELEMPDLGRSGTRFQLCYNLRAVAHKSNDRIWSIRAAAICHQFDVTKGTTLWINSSGAASGIYEKVKGATAAVASPANRDFSTTESSFRASLSIHLLYAHWAQDEWRPYVKFLKEQVKDKVRTFAHSK